jgi:hypothetical protein
VNVFGIGGYQPSSYIKTSTKGPEKHSFNLSVTQKKADVEHKLEQTPEIWEELAREYDIRNATFDELCDMSLKLYRAGQISFQEHGLLTFDPGKSPQTSGFTFNLIPANPEGRKDWIAEYEARLRQDSKINPSSCAFDQKLILILKRLDR